MLRSFPTPVVLWVFIAGGCGFWEVKSRTELPHVTQSSDQLDRQLPIAWTLFQKRTPQIELMWMGNAQSEWELVRHDISGALLRRVVKINYVFRNANACLWNDVYLAEEHIANGHFSGASIRGPVLSSDGTQPIGNPIECGVVERATVGYHGAASRTAAAH